MAWKQYLQGVNTRRRREDEEGLERCGWITSKTGHGCPLTTSSTQLRTGLNGVGYYNDRLGQGKYDRLRSTTINYQIIFLSDLHSTVMSMLQ